jgi:hypothetical protein
MWRSVHPAPRAGWHRTPGLACGLPVRPARIVRSHSGELDFDQLATSDRAVDNISVVTGPREDAHRSLGCVAARGQALPVPQPAAPSVPSRARRALPRPLFFCPG